VVNLLNNAAKYTGEGGQITARAIVNKMASTVLFHHARVSSRRLLGFSTQSIEQIFGTHPRLTRHIGFPWSVTAAVWIISTH
jgi:hypothetical protein